MFFESGFDMHEPEADGGFLSKSRVAFNSTSGFNSDPYRESSDVLPGVPSVAIAQFGWPGPMHKANDDYSTTSSSDDDVVRVCSKAHATEYDSNVFGKQTEGLFTNLMPETLGCGLKEDDLYSSIHCPSVALQGSACPLRFQQDDVPPVQPTTEHFHLLESTTFITTKEIHNVANSILDFLDLSVIASVQKIRPQKYSIKVDIFVEHIMCTAKIRIWKVESKENHYAIEFQRRAGDAFIFTDAYSRCLDFLALQHAEFSGASGQEKQKAVASPQAPPTECSEMSDKELDAKLFNLLELASAEQCAKSQAEAASALARLACDDVCIAKYFSKAEVLDKFLPLLSCDAIDVAYPTARMLSAVAMNATTSIAEHRIAEVVIKKISEPGTKHLARLELAKAVSAGIRSQPHQITLAQAQQLQQHLESSIQNLTGDPINSLIRSSLQDCLLELAVCGSPAY